MSPGYAVVGLHRGGTSAVAGVLHHLGVYLGEEENFFPPSEHNPKGYFEDKRIVALHDQMLGGDWKDPTLDYEPFIEDYRALLTEWQAHPLWAIKDPRLCFTLHALAEVVPGIRVILVSRSPRCAAESLYKRGGHEREEAEGISLLYDRFWRQIHDRPPVGCGEAVSIWYDFLVTNPPLAVAEMAKFIGVPVTQEAIDFIDPGLNHHKWESK